MHLIPVRIPAGAILACLLAATAAMPAHAQTRLQPRPGPQVRVPDGGPDRDGVIVPPGQPGTPGRAAPADRSGRPALAPPRGIDPGMTRPAPAMPPQSMPVIRPGSPAGPAGVVPR